jgi:hypothetical protein
MTGAASEMRKTFSGAGRPRKFKPRERNGQIQRSRPQIREDVMGVVKAQRLRVVDPKDVLDQDAENPLGVLLLQGKIKPHHVAAGREYARLVRAVKRDMDSPREDAKPGGLTNLLPGSGGLFLSPELLYAPEELRRQRGERLGRYNRAFEALHDAGYEANACVNTVAIREMPIPDEKVPLLIAGLNRLADHLGTRG